MKGASGPNITQVVKPVSKYRKQASSAFQLPLRKDAIKRLITKSPVCGCLARQSLRQKKRHRTGRIASHASRPVGSVALLAQPRASVSSREGCNRYATG